MGWIEQLRSRLGADCSAGSAFGASAPSLAGDEGDKFSSLAEEMRKVLPLASSFTWMGVEMFVASHSCWLGRPGCRVELARLACRYLDRNGVVQTITFSPAESRLILDFWKGVKA